MQTASKCEIRPSTSCQRSFTLFHNDVPYFIRGAGINESSDLHLLKKCGGNSVRTWGVDAANTDRLLKECLDLGLTVTIGLRLADFDYETDEGKKATQRILIIHEVKKYRNHHSLLIWGLGNELEHNVDEIRWRPRWNEINYLAEMIKKIDPYHPVMTVLAGARTSKVQGVLQNCTNIDILGINAYGHSAQHVYDRLLNAGWVKPFILTEFAHKGDWDARTTSLGAYKVYNEPTSQEKADAYGTIHWYIERATSALGSYCFFWGPPKGPHRQVE